jgi:hypothetical protein
MCGTQCVNLNTDSKNCGACGQACGTGAACEGATCVCPTGQSVCNKACVNVVSDPDNCGFCAHNCQGGTCMAGLCPTTPIGTSDNGQILQDMVIDTTDVYWSWEAPNAPMPTNGGVTHKPFAGGAKQSLLLPYGTLSNNESVGDVRGIWVDAVNLYATDSIYGVVFSYDLPSMFQSFSLYEAPIQLYNDAGTDAGVAPTGGQPVAVTADSNNVYWVDYYNGQVWQAPINGGSNAILLAGQRNRPVRLAVSGGYVYWIDYGTTQAGTGSVNRIAIGGGGTVTQLASGQDEPEGIATDGINVYWTSRTNTGSVNKVPVAGGTATVLADNQGGPWAIVVDQPAADAGASQAFVYWTNYNDNNIQKVPTTNTGPSAPYVLASQQNNPVAIAVDAKAVYWANQGDGTLWKVAK